MRTFASLMDSPSQLCFLPLFCDISPSQSLSHPVSSPPILILHYLCQNLSRPFFLSPFRPDFCVQSDLACWPHTVPISYLRWSSSWCLVQTTVYEVHCPHFVKCSLFWRRLVFISKNLVITECSYIFFESHPRR